jgi:hypothetical protein
VRRLTSKAAWATPGQAGLVRGPGLGVEVAAEAPGHVLMRQPFFGHGQMPVQQPLGDRLQLAEQAMVGMVVIRHAGLLW